MQEIFVQPEDMWDAIASTPKGETETIAENPTYGIVVTLFVDAYGFPELIVEADGIEVYHKNINGRYDSMHTTEEVYREYLTDRVVEILDRDEAEAEAEAEEEDDESREELIEERESDIDRSVRDFLFSATDGEFDNSDPIVWEAVEDIKEHFLQYVFDNYGDLFPIHRPMFLEDEDGVFFAEYPYPQMVNE